MKMYLSPLILVSLLFWLSHTAIAQSYDFSSQDPAYAGSSPPLYHGSANRFYGNSNFGSPPYTTLTWYTHGSNAMNQDLIDVINSYKGLLAFPTWIDISTSESSQSSGPDVTLNFTSCPGGAPACTVDNGYVLNYTKMAYTVYKFTIRVPNYSSYTDQEQHLILAHELGHVLGLADKYLSNGACSGANSVMDALGCNMLMGPTPNDGWNLYKYFQACGQWCGWLELDTSSLSLAGTTVSSKWIHKHWYSRTGHVKYLKSNSQSGPWTLFHTDLESQNLGFFEDAVSGTNNQYILNTSKDVGSMTDKDWVLICARPLLTWGVWGLEKCMPNSVYVP